MTRFELVAIDVDGTLLTSSGEIDPKVKFALSEARQAGTRVSLVSGRPAISLRPLLRELGIDDPYIASAGALAARPATGEILFHFPLDRSLARSIVEIARAHGLACFFEEPERVVGDGDPRLAASIGGRFGYDMTIVRDVLADTDSPPTKIFLTADPAVLHEIEGEIKRAALPVHLGFPFADYVEVTRADVNKGSSLQRLAGILNIPMSRVLALGDSGNDLPMFRVAGLSVAMGNAPDHVQAQASVVAPTNDQAGVAWALRELVAA